MQAEVRELSIRLRVVYRGFDLEIDDALELEGVTAIFGASGSGKSTLLRAIAGFERPMSGRIAFSVLLLLLVGLADTVSAQMFSGGSNRSSLSNRLRSKQRSRRGTGPEASENIGDVEGSERFVRGNRSTADFVGADTLDQSTFVGAGEVDITQDVRTAVEDLRPTRERDLNERMRESRSPFP